MRHAGTIVAVLFAVVWAQAQPESLVKNGDFEQWTSGLPNDWIKGGPVTLTQSSLLNGSASVLMNAVSGDSNVQYFRQVFSSPIVEGSFFYVAFDIAFQSAASGRDWNLNLTAGGTTSVFNMYYRTDTLYIYNGSSWVPIDSSGVMSASNFDANVIHPYRIIIEGIWLGPYTVAVLDPRTEAVLLHQTGLNHYQRQVNATFINFDLSRGVNQILIDNVAVYPQNPNLPVVDAGLNTTVELPENSLILSPVISNTVTPEEALIVQWSQVSGPSLSFSTLAGETANDLNAKVIFDGGRGEYLLHLTVTDERGLTGEDTIHLRVKDPAIDDVLLGHWGFEEMAGTVAADMLDAAAGNNAADDGYLAAITEPNLPQWIPGWVGSGALEFLGGQLVDVNDVVSQDPNMRSLRWEITAAGWIKLDPQKSGGYRTLVGRSSPFNWMLRKAEQHPFAEFVLQMDEKQIWLTGTTNILDGYWHHLAGTFDGRRAVLYVDGLEEASAEAGRDLIRLSTQSELSIGGRRDQNHFLAGAADDVWVYSYALGAEQIAELVKRGVNVPPRIQIDPEIPTYLVKQFNDTVALSATLIELNPEDEITSMWSVVEPELASFVSFGDAAALQTTASFAQAGVYTLRLTVNDGIAGLAGDIYDEIVITVNEPVCDDLLIYDEAFGRYVNPYLSADISGPEGRADCYVNFYDLAMMAANWLLCNDPEGQGCQMLLD